MEDLSDSDFYGVPFCDLQSGDWVECRYAGVLLRFYVVSNSGRGIELGHRGWLVGHTIIEPLSFLHNREYKYLGKGSFRWWHKWLPGIFKEVIHPYALPKGVKNVES